MKVLVVKSPFGGHEIGHAIGDPAEIEEILAGEHVHHVVAADHPEAGLADAEAIATEE